MTLTINEMIQKKKELGYSCKQIAEKSGVPLGTVQKIFSGITTTPRHETLSALSKAFPQNKSRSKSAAYNTDSITYSINNNNSSSDFVAEASSLYDTSAYNMAFEESNAGKTIDDYLALPEGTRIEMIDGVFYDMAAPTTIHQSISVFLAGLFNEHISKNKGECFSFAAPTDVQLNCDNKTMVQPDVLIVCDRDKITKARIVGAPDLIVEILSPSNWYMDAYRKLRKYYSAGVREYWIVVPDAKFILVYNFEKNGNNHDYIEYTFEDTIPVGIWNDECKIDFKEIYTKIDFLYE